MAVSNSWCKHPSWFGEALPGSLTSCPGRHLVTPSHNKSQLATTNRKKSQQITTFGVVICCDRVWHTGVRTLREDVGLAELKQASGVTEAEHPAQNMNKTVRLTGKNLVGSVVFGAMLGDIRSLLFKATTCVGLGLRSCEQ